MSIRELPPVINILIAEEVLNAQTTESLARTLKQSDLAIELSRQADWTIEHFNYDAQPSAGSEGGFAVVPSSVLDPFARVGKCSELLCRLDEAAKFARSVGLLSDGAIVIDPFTSVFSADGLRSNVDHMSQHIFAEIKVLQRLMPLIEAGFLRFGSSTRLMCDKCYSELKDRLRDAATALFAATDKTRLFADRLPNDVDRISLTLPFSPDENRPLSIPYTLARSDAKAFQGVRGPRRIDSLPPDVAERLFKALESNLYSDLCTICMAMTCAHDEHAVLLTGCRAEARYLKALDAVGESASNMTSWESLRTVDLPWINNLSPEQVVILRDRASKALPRLRALLSNGLGMPKRDDAVSEIVSNLREQAAEVEAELSELKSIHPGYDVGMGALGLSLVIYGLMSQMPAAAVGSVAALMLTLRHLQERADIHEGKKGELISRPAYAVLQARYLSADGADQRVGPFRSCGPGPPHAQLP